MEVAGEGRRGPPRDETGVGRSWERDMPQKVSVKGRFLVNETGCPETSDREFGK